MIRKTIAVVLFGLLGFACADYGGYQDPECEEVTCNSPPAATCVDSLTVRSYKSPGTCKAGECTYGFNDIECGEGECVGGVCEGCEPACSGPSPTWSR